MYYKSIKAAEQLPEEGGEYFVLIGDVQTTARYRTYKPDWWINDSDDTFPSDQIEWLSPCDDEISRLQERVKELEAEVERLGKQLASYAAEKSELKYHKSTDEDFLSDVKKVLEAKKGDTNY